MKPVNKYSEILGKSIYIDRDAGTVETEDGLIYNRGELKLLKNASPEMKRGLHKIKMFFEGEICQDNTKRLLIR